MKNKNQRLEHLREILLRVRNETMTRVRTIRNEQNDDTLSAPGDVMDIAKSLSDVETHASLIDRAQNQLRQIDNALSQLEQGDYGVCANCGEEIPLARLQVIPFATYCVDCQENVNRGSLSQGSARNSAYRQWTPPPEADENSALADEPSKEIDEINVREETPFSAGDIELEEDEELPDLNEPRSGRRGRPAKKHD